MMAEHQTLDEELAVLKSYIVQCETELKALTVAKKKSAAPRIRKSLQQIKNHSHKMRGSVTESVKSMPTKTRAKKEAVDVPIEEARQLQAEPLFRQQSEPEAEPEAEPTPVKKPKIARKSRARKVVVVE